MTRKYASYFSPDLNDGKHVFVFGSNLAGRHGAGAARTALILWGAVLRYGEGRQGQSYGIPTKDENIETLDIEDVALHVETFLDYARANPDLTFLVTAVGTGLAGLSHEDIAPMFQDAPMNCVLPMEWKKYVE